MKLSVLILPLLALTAAFSQAATVYTIHLVSSEKFTDCSILYAAESTKFRGKDSSGKMVTKEVPSSHIVMMREVEVEEQPEPEQAKEPATDATPAAEQTAPAAEASAAPAEPEAKPEEPIADGNIVQKEGEQKAKDVTLRLRTKLASIDEGLASITKPSRSLVTRANAAKTRVSRRLETMDKLALEVSSLQEQFNQAGAADYQFTIVTPEQRDAYVRDAQAAYKAMRVDMKQKKGRRKVGGLDKFEIMRERYQGIPEYKRAYEWYLRTLRSLNKQWTKQLAAEESRRKKLQPDRARAAKEQDQAQFDKLAAQLKAEGDDIATVWYVPNARNVRMLSTAVHKVEAALRSAEKETLDDAVGTVPNLITQYWEAMDAARTALVTGDFAGAEKILQEDGSFPILNRLNAKLIPNEYRDGLRKQRQDFQNEIRNRSRKYASLKRDLERRTSMLDRETSGADAQLDSVLEEIAKERDTDTGEKTMEVDKPAAPAAAPAPEKK